MSSYADFTREAPDLAARVRARFEAHLHHVMGTLRADGSPRLSGTEARFFEGELYLGSMPGARKLADLRRDPRVALHAATVDVKLEEGDAKVSGRAVECDPDEARRFFASLGREHDAADSEATEAADGLEADAAELPGTAFRLDLRDAVVTTVEGDELVVTTWRAGSAPTVIRRR